MSCQWSTSALTAGATAAAPDSAAAVDDKEDEEEEDDSDVKFGCGGDDATVATETPLRWFAHSPHHLNGERCVGKPSNNDEKDDAETKVPQPR